MSDAGAVSWGTPCCVRHWSLVFGLLERSKESWWCTQVTEDGDNSTTGFEASRYFTNHLNIFTNLNIVPVQTDWMSTAEMGAATPKDSHGGLLLCELTPSPFSTLPSLSPALLSESWAEVSASRSWTISKAFRTPHSGLLRAGWLQSPSSQAPSSSNLEQLAPTDFYVRKGQVFPYEFDGGTWFQSVGVIPPK